MLGIHYIERYISLKHISGHFNFHMANQYLKCSDVMTSTQISDIQMFVKGHVFVKWAGFMVCKLVDNTLHEATEAAASSNKKHII